MNSHAPLPPHGYNGIVLHSAIRAAAAITACCLALGGAGGYARAQQGAQTLDAGTSPMVRVVARSANVTVQTWDRPQVKVESPTDVRVVHFRPAAVAGAIRGGDIAIFETQVVTPRGVVRLPQEDFPVDGIAGAAHDGVVVFGGDAGETLVITVPANTALVLANIGRGSIAVRGYRGAMVAQVHTGDVSVDSAGGEAYLEAARGSIRVTNSSFDRIRARTAVGNVYFSGCSVRQVEVDTIRGQIAYDEGTFLPGVARFESQQGNIAIGLAKSGVQIGAHSGSGRIVSDFGKTQGNDAQQTANGGGPVVTVNAHHGTVFLLNGSLKGRPKIQRRLGTLAAPRARTCARPRCPI